MSRRDWQRDWQQGMWWWLGNEWYLDGAVTDSIPYEHMLDMGYDRVVVVLTKPADYIKKPMPRLFTSVYKKRFPRFYEAFSNRHIK